MIVFLDTETTGLDPECHELIEIAVVKVSPAFEELEHIAVKVKPMCIGTADPAALAVNGYSPEAWADAMDLEDALELVAPWLAAATFIGGHNVQFDVRFMLAVLFNPNHRVWWAAGERLDVAGQIDTCVMARQRGIKPATLAEVCGVLGIERPTHRALDDTRASLAVARRWALP